MPVFLEKCTHGGQENGALRVVTLDREETQNLMPLGAVRDEAVTGGLFTGSKPHSHPLASPPLPADQGVGTA